MKQIPSVHAQVLRIHAQDAGLSLLRYLARLRTGTLIWAHVLSWGDRCELMLLGAHQRRWRTGARSSGRDARSS